MSQSRYKCFQTLALLATLSGLDPTTSVAEGSFDLGVGFGAVDHRDGLDLGWTYKIGYEFGDVGNFHAGVQWHGQTGVSDRNDLPQVEGLSFRSNALYATFRPTPACLSGIQFSTGIVLADYRSSYYDEAGNRTVIRDPDPSRTGFALGVAIVLPFADVFRLHLLDYHRYRIGGETFDLYGISVAALN
jgi:hypothetical protein